MSLYADLLYADGYYGSSDFGSAPGGTVNLNAYQNNIDSVVLYWALSLPSASIHNFVWTVETDLVDTFTSPDKVTYVTSDAKITLAGPLVSGNTVSVTVNGVPVSTLFTVDTATTLAAWAAAIALEPNVASATVAGSSVIIRYANVETPATLTALTVTGGASQTTAALGTNGDFIAGRIQKGIAVPIYPRLQGVERAMYWRVKGIHGASPTSFSSSVFMIPQAIDEVSRDAMLDLMPDPIYKKDAGSNNFGMHWTYGKSLDTQYIGDIFADNDIALTKVRDISLQGKFGDYVDILRPQAMKAIDFREIMKQFWAEARQSPTVRSVRNVCRAALGQEPVITPIRNTIDLEVADDTLGQTVDAFYVPDEDFYQTITFSTDLITGNSYSVDVDAVNVTTAFNTDNDTTLADIATNLSGEPGIAFAAVVDGPGGPGTARVIVLRAANPLTPPVLTNSLVTGGASQATAVPAAAGAILPATTWDNVHLAGGVIVYVTNPIGAIVDKRFLQAILRKLILANFPLYVTGIA